jgi:hypothetical protein
MNTEVYLSKDFSVGKLEWSLSFTTITVHTRPLEIFHLNFEIPHKSTEIPESVVNCVAGLILIGSVWTLTNEGQMYVVVIQ